MDSGAHTEQVGQRLLTSDMDEPVRSLVAIDSEPLLIQPVACPVSSSSLA